MNEVYFEKLEQYFGNELNELEKLQLEKEMAQNPDLRQEFQKHQLAIDAIDLLIEKNIRTKFQEWQPASRVKEVNSAPPARSVSTKKIYFRPIAIAASFLILVALAFTIWINLPQKRETLAQHFYQTPELSKRTSFQGTASELEEGFQLFENKNYQEAIPIFLKLEESSGRYAEAQYLLAHAYFQLKKFDQAIVAFKKVAASEDQRYKEKADWNLLLSYLAMNDRGPAFQQAKQKILDHPQHSYWQQTKELQENL